MKLRWENYILNSDTGFNDFWETYYKEETRNTLFIIGIGFDPRSIEAAIKISSIPNSGGKDVMGLRYYADEVESQSNHTPPEVQVNIDKLQAIVTNKSISNLSFRGIVMRSADDKHIASINSTKLFNSITELSAYSEVIVDISAMPRGIFIPLLNKLLSMVDTNNAKEGATPINLHVVVTENSQLDSKIQDLGSADEASFIYGFTVPDQTSTQIQKRVWIPMLGESQTEQFSIIRKSIEPVETCVILPFPSKNLKRGDLILDEYKELLYNDQDFEPRNILYVNESNPFHVYRLLSETIARYQKSFELLEGCKIIISALSSKILSLGAFMAVYESKRGENNRQNVGIKQVESMSHKIEDKAVKNVDNILTENTSIHVWLAGLPYIE
jgi:hypothetical protein